MSEFNNRIPVDAILWDFDGTLANSAAKNIAITKQILARVAPRLTGAGLPLPLASEAGYHFANHAADNWRDLYRDFFTMTEVEIENAAPLWETYQMLDATPVTLFDGVVETVRRLAGIPQGICSANATRNIRQVLQAHEIGSVFSSVIGYDGLPWQQQKPAPDGGLKCLAEIFGEAQGKTIIYIGDHVADVMFSRSLAERLGPASKVISVVATHSGAKPQHWRVKPDVVIDDPSGLSALVMHPGR